MRYIAIIAVGLGILPTLACGSSNNGTAKAGAGAKCTTNGNCQSGSCIAGACTAPVSGSGGFPSSSGGFGGSPVGSGGELTASGGSLVGSGGDIFGSGGSLFGSGGVIGASGDSGTVPNGGSSGDSGTVKDGQAPPPPVDGGRPPKPGGGDILCDQATCKNRDVCCGSPGQGMGSAPMYACSPDACTQGATSINCDGYEDCSGSQKCCLTTGGGFGGGGTPAYACADQCAGVDVQCTSTKNCNGGEVCCETVGMFGASKTACETGTGCQNSPPAMNPTEYQLCEANADCPQGTQCTLSTNLPGFRICK
jgi:hypothetical protein